MAGGGPVAVLIMLVPLVAFIGWSLQKVVLNRAVGDDPIPSLIATFGLSIALQNLMPRFGPPTPALCQVAASLTGINPKRIYASATASAVGILGFAAVFQSLRSTVAPSDGPFQLIYAFEAVIIGGMGSIWGAFIGAMVLGISQAIGFRINPGFGILAGHLVFLLILALRPQGILGNTS